MKPLGHRISTVSGNSSPQDQPLSAAPILSTAGGLLTSLGRTEGGEKLDRGPSSRRTAHLWRFALWIPVIGICTWAIVGANNARVAEIHWDKVTAAAHHLESSQWYAPPQAYEYLFTNASAAVAAEPGDIHYRHWLGVYKWLSLTSYVDPNTEQLRSEAVPWARQIVAELHQARPLCPTFGPLYCIAGEIEEFSLEDPGGAERIRKGFRLAPCHPDVCFTAGRIDAEAGNAEQAFEKLARAAQLDGGCFPKAASLLIGTLDRGDLALRLAGDDAGRLAHVGGLLAGAGKTHQGATSGGDPVANPDDRVQLARQAQTQAFEQLKAKCERPDAPASAHASLANLYRQQGELDMAIRHYRRALRLDYDQVGWHYALAQVLVQAERVEEAVHEAQICLRLRPDHAPAKQMLEKLSIRPITIPGASSAGP